MSNQNKNTDEQQWKSLVCLLDEIRKQKGISQIEIAEKTELLQSNISRFFLLKYNPTLGTFLLIANSLEINLFKILENYLKNVEL